jgi:hypothetical protein
VLFSMLTKDERKKKNSRDEVKDKRTNDDFFMYIYIFLFF